MCDWFEVRLERIFQSICFLILRNDTAGIFEHFFSDLGAQGEAKEAYSCTLTAPSPKRDNELRKKAKKISGQA